MVDYAIRPITHTDKNVVIHHRRRMFEDMDLGTSETLNQMELHFAAWLQIRLDTQRYIGWFAHTEEHVIAGVGIWLIDWVYGPDGKAQLMPYVTNVYVEPAYRKQGIARQLMAVVIDHCATQKYSQIRLHASVMGRKLYEELGFEASNEMVLKL